MQVEQYRLNSLQAKKLDNGTATVSLTLEDKSVSPHVLEVHYFLSPVEVQHLISLSSNLNKVEMRRASVLASSVTYDSTTGQGTARSSAGGWIHCTQDAVVDAIFRRLADLLHIDEDLMQDLADDRPVLEGEIQPLPAHDRVVEAMQLMR